MEFITKQDGRAFLPTKLRLSNISDGINPDEVLTRGQVEFSGTNNLLSVFTKRLALKTNTLTPVNGDIWYGGADGGATSGFNFYSNDPNNASNTVSFSNSNNYLSIYQDSTVNNWLYVKPGSRFVISVDGANSYAYSANETEQAWQTGTKTSGTGTNFRWTCSNNTGQTAGTEASAFVFAPTSIQYATGAQIRHRAWWVAQQTVSFVGASTVTNAANTYIEGAIIGGANATITSSYGLLVGGLTGTTSVGAGVTTAYGIFSNAPTGASTNYALGISGNFNLLGDIVTDTTTGFKLGTSNLQKLGLFNATPIVQPTTSVAAATFVPNASANTLFNESTFDGYTIGRVVRALRNLGILA